MTKWAPGTFQTKDLKARIEELLCLIESLAQGHRQAGRLLLAGHMEELTVAVREYQRLLENTLSSYRVTSGEQAESK